MSRFTITALLLLICACTSALPEYTGGAGSIPKHPQEVFLAVEFWEKGTIKNPTSQEKMVAAQMRSAFVEEFQKQGIKVANAPAPGAPEVKLAVTFWEPGMTARTHKVHPTIQVLMDGRLLMSENKKFVAPAFNAYDVPSGMYNIGQQIARHVAAKFT